MAMNQWLLGHPDRALVAVGDALRLTAQLEHPLTEAIALWFAAWVHLQRGDRDATVATSERLVSVTSQHGFSPWTDAAIVLLPAARGDRLDRDALADVHRRLVAGRGTAWRHLLCLCALAELYVDAGLADDGLRMLSSISDQDRGTIFAPELHRLEGELLLRRSEPAPDEAERCFRRAIELARARAEKSLELRAATSLARLLATRGRRGDARDILAPIYGWFTEGFDTADLRAANTLLAELG
jgi:hypothetical protein